MDYYYTKLFQTQIVFVTWCVSKNLSI